MFISRRNHDYRQYPGLAWWRVFATTILLATTLHAVAANAADYYVAPRGSDAASGSYSAPFRSIQHAADLMHPGDTCWLRAGTYRESVQVARGGRPGQPMRFVAYPGENVALSGTRVLQTAWQVYRGSIYKTRIDVPVDQLFVDGQMMIEARWPNMTLGQLWDRSCWAHAGKGSRYGLLKDPELAKTGIDWTGALATLNVAHQFYTWTRLVTRHRAGSDGFHYPKDLGKSIAMRYGNKSAVWEDDRYYLSGKLAALDIPTEWFFDRKSKTLFLWTPDGRPPAKHRIEVKVRDVTFRVNNADYVHLEGMHFFATTFVFHNCNHCVVDNCHLLFPTYTRELTELNARPRATIRTQMLGNYNTVRNCSIAYSPTSGLQMSGRQNVVENNLLHDLCWNGSLRYCGIQMNPGGKSAAKPGGIVRHNTVYNCGNAIINYRAQPYLIEYNHVHDGGLACKDVALIYTGGPTCAGSIVHHNWAHGCRTETGGGLGIRGDDQTRRLTVHHNVVWDCGRDGIIVKGDFNRVLNNTCLFIGTRDRLGNYITLPTRPEPKKAWRQQYPLLEVQNAHSDAFNNVARTISQNAGKRTPLPSSARVANNYRGARPRLVDLNHWDFRPRADAPLIDAGRVISGITETVTGKAPDIGAYEYATPRWLPGHYNGVSITTIPAAAGSSQLRARVALLMPIANPIELAVRLETAGHGTALPNRLLFTPSNWMQPQEVRLRNPSGTRVDLQFETPSWGKAIVRDVPSGSDHAARHARFERPDIGTPRPLDIPFNTLYFPPKRRGPQRSVRPTARAYQVSHAPRIDGRIDDDEWVGWGPDQNISLFTAGTSVPGAKVLGSGLVLFDRSFVYVGVRINCPSHTAPGDPPKDALEIQIQPIHGHVLGPVSVYRMRATGKAAYWRGFGPVDKLVAKHPEKLGPPPSVSFQASTAASHWDVELRLPMAQLNAKNDVPIMMRFNVRILTNGKWVSWTPATKSDGTQTGNLVFRPVCRSGATNLLRNGSFERAELGPWYAATNQGKMPAGKSIKRVHEGTGGGWCIRIENHDATAMEHRVIKWIHPLPKSLGAGTYLLSYDVRVAELQPREPSGMFCAYLRTGVAGDSKAGSNAGQMDYGIACKTLAWTRRDCVITIPHAAFPQYLSMQLHKATGTVWIDNVRLVKLSRQED